jgi:alkylation response protein AidB-like acyl-CoA dehydrogenase
LDLELSDDQELYRSTTRRFIESTLPLPAVRALGDASASVDDGHLAQAAELGWFATLVPEALGGGSVSGRGVEDAAVVAEERGRFLQPDPYVPMNVVAAALASGGTPEMQAKVLPALVAGEARATCSLAEPFTGDGPGTLTARRTDGTTRVSGRLPLVQDAHVASWLLVRVDGTDGAEHHLLPTDRPGITVERKQGFDLTRQVADVRFDDVELSPADALGGATPDALLDLAAVLTVAESVGAMDHIFELVVDYAKARVAFGRPIGSFQAVKHQLADAALLLEASKAISVAATRAVQNQADNASEVASMAKSFVADAGLDVVHTCWQVFGGIGYTWEHDLHLFLRRLTLDGASFGDAAWHRERICRLHQLGAPGSEV